MADYEPPSFSLGLDLDSDSEPQIAVPDQRAHDPPPAPDSSYNIAASVPVDDEGEDFVGEQVPDSDPESGADPHRILKRLRRGLPVNSSSGKVRDFPPSFCLLDDDIQEFSSEEDFIGAEDARPTTHYHTGCSSSKIPLRGFLSTSSSSQLNMRKRKQVSDAPTSTSLETVRNELFFSNITISPLRKFQLIESDSDDSSGGDKISKKGHEYDPSGKEQQSISNSSVAAAEQKKNVAASKTQNGIWKYFDLVKSIPTPALDEVCDEYFQSVNKNKAAEKLEANIAPSSKSHDEDKDRCPNDPLQWDKAESCPPSHRYFFHEDPKIQKLVRDRLANFSPLGIANNTVNHQPSASVIDYMRQFGSGEASTSQAPCKNNIEKKFTKSKNKSKRSNNEKPSQASGEWVDPKFCSSSQGRKTSKRQAPQKKNSEKASRKGRYNSNKPKSDVVLQESGSWVNPKSSFSLPMDAGQRRVQASGESAGHWFTSSGGRKVYVTKTGQELTGRAAYRHHKKDISKKDTSKKRKR